MKRCPKCNRRYEDDTLRFCLDDGRSLVIDGAGPTKAGVTLLIPPPAENQPTLSEVDRPDVPAPGAAPADELRGVTARAERRPTRKIQGSSSITLIIGIILAVALLLTAAGVGLWGWTFARRIPMLILCLAGMVLGLVRSKRHPRVSLMASLGLGLYLLESFVYTGILSWLPRLAETMEIPTPQRATAYTILAVMDDFAFAAVILLLVGAAFTGRDSSSRVSINGR